MRKDLTMRGCVCATILANNVASNYLVIVSKLSMHCKKQEIGGVVTSRDSFSVKSGKSRLNYLDMVYSVTYTFYSYVFLLT